MWRNDLPYTVFDSGTLDGFKGAVNRWLHLRVVCFLQLSVAQVLDGLRKQLINNFVFPIWPVVLVLIIIIIEPRGHLNWY